MVFQFKMASRRSIEQNFVLGVTLLKSSKLYVIAREEVLVCELLHYTDSIS